MRFSFTMALAYSHSPEHAETIAIREGLRQAERFGYTNYILESDCKGIIDQLLAWSRTLGSLVTGKFTLLWIDSQLFYLMLVVMLISRRIY